MGRDWLNWTAAAAATTSGSRDGGRETNEETSTGCMCSVFQLFGNDFQVPLNHHHSSKLLPGPGNTVELKEQDNLNFRGFKIKTRLSSSSSRRDENLSTQCSSPGTKTPNLVARLMGLDLLPECTSSPSSNATKSMRNDRRASFEDDCIRSLPETPRMSISSARRSNSDYHRLSLQNNRENIKEEMKLSAKIRARRRFREHVHDENRSPGRYAKQIVKQIKETVSRRVGLDITNINRDSIRRDENLILKKNLDEISKQSDAPSWSPKLRFFYINRSKQVTNSDSKNSRNPTVASNNHQSCNFQVTMQGSENSCSRKDRAIRKKKEEQYVHSTAKNKADFRDKKFKKVPLSNELLPVKKHPSPHATKLPQKQAQFCSKSRQTYKQLHLKTDRKLTVVEPGGTSRCATAAAEYRCYIEWILNRAAIVDDVTPLSFGKWHTASHPLDPSIFYYLELFHPSGAADAALVLSHRCNRKLIFQLVDELLADILKPQLDFRPWIFNSPVKPNFELVDRLCNKIAGFPAANCEVLEDIDSLIGKDLRKTQLIEQFEEESEGLVNEIEDEIMDSLVRETAATVVGIGTME